jgi:hypothetical protein
LDTLVKAFPHLNLSKDLLMSRVGDVGAHIKQANLAKMKAYYDQVAAQGLSPQQWEQMRADPRPFWGAYRLVDVEKLLSSVRPPEKGKQGSPQFIEVPGPNGTKVRKAVVPREGDEYPIVPDRVPAGQQPVPVAPIVAVRPTPAEGKQVDPATGLSHNALYQGGVAFALTGQMPQTARSGNPRSSAQREAFQNIASELAAQAGVDLPQLRTEYAANKGSLTKQIARYNATMAVAEQAKGSLENARAAARDMPRTGSPIYNRYKQYITGQTLTGDPRLTRLEVFVYDAARDYARTTAGAAESVGQMTDTANAQADRLLNAAQTPEAFEAALNAMARGMETATNALEQQIGRTSGTIRRFLNPNAPDSDQKTAQSSAGGGSITITDGKGNYYQAPAGTPIPAGYTKVGG